MTNKTPFRPTLTLTHHEGGRDGTYGVMLHEMAAALYDGPVDARVTYWDPDIKMPRTIEGSWAGYEPWGFITFENEREARTIHLEDIKELSI